MKTTSLGLAITGSVFGVLALSSVTSAQQLYITPGLWEVVTLNDTVGTHEVEHKCIMDPVFDPVSILGEEEGCEIWNERIAGNGADYDLICVDYALDGRAEGRFSFYIDGYEGHGSANVILSASDESMAVQYSVDARWLGDC